MTLIILMFDVLHFMSCVRQDLKWKIMKSLDLFMLFFWLDNFNNCFDAFSTG